MFRLTQLEKSLSIERLSHDGRGIARTDGKIGFVAGALPGEIVRARRTRTSARHDEWRVVRIETAAAERVEPPCAYYGRCGGCDLQHLSASAQIVHKRDALLDLLARQAGLEPRLLDATIESPALHYRRRARLAIDTRGRGTPRVGFREFAGSAIVAVDRCTVLDTELQAALAGLPALLGALTAPRGVGHIDLAVSETREGNALPVVGLRVLGALDAADGARLADFGAALRAFVATEHDDGTVRLLHAPHAEAPGYLLPDFDLRLEFAPGDFLQANASVNRRVVARVVEWLAPARPARLLDAFCGLGNLSLPLARALPGTHVLGIDASSGMVARARRNAEANSLDNVELAVRDLDAPTPPLTRSEFDAVVLDPPRAGAPALVELIAARRVPIVVYQSCAPATLARDARVLGKAGYRLERLCAVDMFPQTSHSEALAMFRR